MLFQSVMFPSRQGRENPTFHETVKIEMLLHGLHECDLCFLQELQYGNAIFFIL